MWMLVPSCVLYCTVLYCTVLHCTAVVLSCTVLYSVLCTVLYCTALYTCYPSPELQFPDKLCPRSFVRPWPPAAAISLANAAVNCSFRRCYPILFPHDTSISRQTETHLFPRAGHVCATCRPGGRIISVSSDVFVGTSLKPNSS